MQPIRVKEGRPNVVLVLIDTARAGYMDFYGGPGVLTPFLSRIAQDSTVLTRAFSTSSWTAPSTASLFTGQYPNQHGVTEGLFVHNHRVAKLGKESGENLELNRIAEGALTLPTLFRKSGYATFGLSSNPNICVPMGFAEGFDRFRLEKNHASAGTLFSLLRGWRSEIEDWQPAFVYLHLTDPHDPYEKHEGFYVAPEDEADEPKARYQSELRYVDDQIRRVYEWLSADQNTIFVVVSDHGEEFSDHGSTGHEPQLYNELNQVIMLFHAPGRGVVRQRVERNVSLIDVLPTLAELAGIDGGLSGAEAGRSLVPILLGGAPRDELQRALGERTLFAHRIDNQGGAWWSALKGHWKLIERPDHTLELYDHAVDLDEHDDVSAGHPDVVRELQEALAEYKAYRPESAHTSVTIDLDPELKESLEALGYVDSPPSEPEPEPRKP